MKKRALFVGLFVACLAVIWSCKTIPLRSGQVINDAFGIVILPTRFSQEDQCKMNEILSRYDTGLYLIKTRGMKKCPVPPPQGTLEDHYTNPTLAAWIDKEFNKPGFTSSAVRVGFWPVHYGPFAPLQTPGPGQTAGRGANPNKLPVHGTLGIGSNPNQQHKLLNELRPILEKYSTTTPTPTPTPQP